MSVTVQPASMSATLARIAAELDGFVGLLRSEQALIATASIDKIEQLSLDKQRALESIRQLLASTSPAADSPGDIETVKALAARIRDSSARAASLNRTNGQMLALRARLTDMRLDSLAEAAGCSRTYGADGGLRVSRTLSRSISI
ncbi:MAG: flagellar export chaperone FlgN [Burkholderiales bacterium]